MKLALFCFLLHKWTKRNGTYKILLLSISFIRVSDTTPGIPTGLKALPGSGKTTKYLRENCKNIHIMFHNMPLFPFGKVFPRCIKEFGIHIV